MASSQGDGPGMFESRPEGTVRLRCIMSTNHGIDLRSNFFQQDGIPVRGLIGFTEPPTATLPQMIDAMGVMDAVRSKGCGSRMNFRHWV